MDGRIDLTISHVVKGRKKKKQVDVMPVPLESAFSHSMLHNTYLSHFPSTLCVNDDAQRPVALPCSPTCYFPLLSFLFLRLYLPARELTERNNLGLWRLERDLYVVERGCVQSKISLFVNETNQNNRIDQAQTFNSRVSWHRIRRTDLLNATGFRVPHWPSPCPRDLVTTYSTFTVSLPFTSFLTHIVTTHLIFLNSVSSVCIIIYYTFFFFS